MASNAVAGIGTQFYRMYDSAWERIAEVNNISGPGMEREFIEVTSLDSTGGFREYITGLRDGGQIEFSMNFTRPAFAAMKEDFDSDNARHYLVVLPDAENTSFSFEGFCTGLPLEIPPDDKITCNVTIKITGEVTVDSGSQSI